MKELLVKYKLTTSDLVSSLKSIEQQSQTLRWRLVNFDDADSLKELEQEVGTLTGLACNVSRLYGRFEVLNGLETEINPEPFALYINGLNQTNPAVAVPDEDGLNVQTTEQAKPLSEPELGGTGYDVIRCLGDTKIVKARGGIGEYETFEAAKSSAIEYLEDVIDQCETSIDDLRDADNPEQYFGMEVVAEDIYEVEGTIQYICG